MRSRALLFLGCLATLIVAGSADPGTPKTEENNKPPLPSLDGVIAAWKKSFGGGAQTPSGKPPPVLPPAPAPAPEARPPVLPPPPPAAPGPVQPAPGPIALPPANNGSCTANTASGLPPPVYNPATDPAPDEEESEEGSSAQLSLIGVSESAFNPANTPFSIFVSCLVDNTTISIQVDGTEYTNITTTPTGATLLQGVPPGFHIIYFLALDTNGLEVSGQFALYFGNSMFTVNVISSTGAPVPGANVTLFLGDNFDVFSQGTATNGTIAFTTTFDATLTVQAVSGQLFGVNGGTLLDSPLTVTVSGVGAPSPIDNNDFSNGTAGYEFSSNADVQLVNHTEAPLSNQTAASLPQYVNSAGSGAGRRRLLSQPVPVNHKGFGRSLLQNGANIDLQLTTSGEGPVTVSRSFSVSSPSITSVKVRYRFITTEVPGGYFGSQYNDYYAVTVNSGQGSVADFNSMNALGLGAFDAAGATGWMELSLPVAVSQGQPVTVQVTGVVANVADGILDSSLIIDFVESNTCSIDSVSLLDVDGTALTFFSASVHPFFGGNTRLNGQFRIKGDETDQLSKVSLETRIGGQLVATTELISGLRGATYVQFDSSQLVTVPSQLLFEVPSSSFAAVSQTTSEDVELMLSVQTQNGCTATKLGKRVPKLVYYDGSNRYGGRDDGGGDGGDSWQNPVARNFLVDTVGTTGGITWGDLSNMNGGPFAPHQTHRLGLSADGYFSGYQARNAAVAQTIIDQLNTYGTIIRRVYVLFTPLFSAAIQNVTLTDGRAATAVIKNVAGHGGHFHWEIQA